MRPTTDAERLIWQRQAHTQLGRLLVRATNEHLPPIRWTVAPALSLHGECSPYAEDPRSEFQAWMAALGEPDSDRMMRSDGSTRLTAVWDRLDGVEIVLTATIFDPPAGE